VTILEVREVRKAFGGLVAVDDVSFTVETGEMSAIIGPNGAGKTTLFNLLTGGVIPDAGQVRFAGRDITADPPPKVARAGIGRSFQVASAFPEYTVFENLQMGVIAHHRDDRRLWRLTRRARIEETHDLLEEVGLVDIAGVEAAEISHGDLKILDVAIALSGEPQLLLLDEPAAGLNSVEAHRIMDVVARIARDRGITVVFIEHDMSMVFGYASIVRVLHQGALLVAGTPDEIRANDEVKRVYLGGYEVA
jgi:branched-chain amino acid transport system ATP-binding protein